MLITLEEISRIWWRVGGGKDGPVKYDNDGDDGACWNDIAPEADDDVASYDFEGYEGGFEDEEVPASSYAEGIINEASSEANEGRGNGEVSDHFRDT